MQTGSKTENGRQEDTLTIRVEHFRDKSNCWWFVWVLLCEGHCEFECAIIKWCIFRSVNTYKE